MLGSAALTNAIVALNAAGGSTNVVLHLIAIAGRAGLSLPVGLFDEIARRTPLLADIEPSGALLCRISTQPAACRPCSTRSAI